MGITYSPTMWTPNNLIRPFVPDHRHLQSVGRNIGLATLVGIASGIGAIIFHLMCVTVVHVALVWVVGYHQKGPKGESEIFHVPESLEIVPWLLLIVPTLGGLLSGWLIYRFAPEAEGHGTDSAIDAYHNHRGYISSNVPMIKAITSAITLGTGGSGGREGPIAQIGAGFGSFLATKLKLSDAERRVLMAAGLGAGIAAIFQAPLAGAIFAVEVLYRDPDFESEALIPAFFATIVAYCMYNVFLALGLGLEGFEPLFEVTPGIRFRDPILLIPLTGLAIAMVIASLVYTKLFYWTHWTFKKLSIRAWLKPAIGAFLTGLIGFSAYYIMQPLGAKAQFESLSVLSFGYGFLQDILADGGGNTLIAVLLVVGFGKMITTALTIGSGGSGGVFGPSMVIGGSLGAVVGLLFQSFMPGTVVRIDMFIILGMASFFAAAANTPVSTLIMVSEMTSSYELLMPSMWVCAQAYLLSRGWTLFSKQVGSRIDSPAHRGDFIIDILQGLTVSDALTKSSRNFTALPPDMPLREVITLVSGTKQSCFPVLDEHEHYHGMFSLNDIRQFLYESAELGELAVATDLAVPDENPLNTCTSLSEAIRQFAECPFEELPVVDPVDHHKVVGMLRRHDVIATYNARLLEAQSGASS